jgi:predicted esterase
MLSRTKFFILILLLASALPLAAAPVPGWKRFGLPESGSYLWRYVPGGVDLSKPDSQGMPAVLFLHGSGGIPDRYRPLLSNAADRAGLVVIVPKSSTDLGWGTAQDELIVAESLRTVQAELSLDSRRLSIGGHSAGGAWAYLLAYTTRSSYSAVFTMAARFYPIDAVADPSYKAPIRMYYGENDPNYAFSPAMKQQWARLGVPWEEEVLPGYGHNTLPLGAVENGFLFLAGKSFPGDVEEDGCLPGPTVLCLGGGRFRVEVAWKDFQGGAGPGSVVPGAVSDDSGLFWFFAPDNWELLVKVLDGCAVNGHRWVFAAGVTTVEYVLTVTDTQTDQAWTWRNPPGRASPAVTDTAALGGCSP